MAELLFEYETYAIRGCAMKVHAEMGSKFLEAVYQECMEVVLAESNIPFVSQAELALSFRGRTLRKKYIADFVCFDKIIVELKCVERIGPLEIAQALNYLKATGYRLALIVNFSTRGPLEVERVVL